MSEGLAEGSQSSAAPSSVDPSSAGVPDPTYTPKLKVPLAIEFQILAKQRAFWVGLIIKLLFATLLGGSVVTKSFGRFLYGFVQNPLTDPFQLALARGEVEAFPYGPMMLLYLSISWLPAAVVDFDPTGHLGLFLLRLPIVIMDLLICVLLMRWLQIRPAMIVRMYWLSPILIYATYIHGQLDLVPTAALCLTLFLLFSKRPYLAALVFAAGLATKLHLLIAFPFLTIYLFRIRRYRKRALRFAGLTTGLTLLLYAYPATSSAFRTMVFATPQSKKLWSTAVPYGADQPMLYLAPALLMLGLMTFASYRKVNRELTLMFLGAVYVAMMALVPPQPGWYLWSLPFVAYMGAQYARTRRIHIAALTFAYLAFFTLARPAEFLGAFDPIFGQRFGVDTAARMASALPGLFGQHASNIAWTVLFCSTVFTALEMFRRGVTSNAVYNFRDQAFMIGIGGDSGAGKHTIGADLQHLMGKHHSTLHGDDDHKWERGHEGWRTYTHLNPRANLLGQQFEALAALRRGGYAEKRHYDHDFGRFTDPIKVEDNSFISIVGLHPFYLPSQRQLLDLKVFVHPEEDVRRAWKVARDMAKRGYSKERVIAQIEQRAPDSEKYVLPQMKYADVVIRYRSADTLATEKVDVEIELGSDLESLPLIDALDRDPAIALSWEPDPYLTRDRVGFTGTLSAERILRLAEQLITNLDEMIENESFKPGGQGLVQLILLHSISVRLRGKRAQGPS